MITAIAHTSMEHSTLDSDSSEQRDGAASAPRDAVRDGATALRQARNQVDFGVVVGIEDYPYFRSLLGAASDARRFHSWLRDSDGGGLADERAKLILSDPRARTPVQDEIDLVLCDILDAAKQMGGARRLYFYFSGHGAMTLYRSASDVALLLTRWSESLVRLALSTESYSSTLCGALLFEEVAIFVDCCSSLSLPAVGMEPLFDCPRGGAQQPTRKFIAFASEASQQAFEVPSPDGWQGLFTRCLLAILRDGPSPICAAALKDRLELEVEIEARRRGFRQRPYVKNGLHMTSCFGHGGQPPLLRLQFAQRRGFVALRDGRLYLVAEWEADGEVWEGRYPAGLYSIEGGGQAATVFHHDGRELPHDV